MPGTVLGNGDTAVNNRKQFLFLWNLHSEKSKDSRSESLLLVHGFDRKIKCVSVPQW